MGAEKNLAASKGKTLKQKLEDLRVLKTELVVLLRATCWTDYLVLLVVVLFCVGLGVVLASLGSQFESYTHADSAEFAEFRRVGNLWLGGVSGFVVGLLVWFNVTARKYLHAS